MKSAHDDFLVGYLINHRNKMATMKNLKIYWIAALLGTLLFTINACYYDQVLPTEVSSDDVGPMSFSGDIIPIFNASCNTASCHNQGGVTPDLSATNAYLSLTSGGYLNTASPKNSSLYHWMLGDNGTPMPPSGTNATYNAKVLAWIEQGALNN